MKITNNKHRLRISAVAILLIISTTGCGKKEEVKNESKPAINVSTQKLSDSSSVKEEIEYPAMVMAKEEAKIIAKTAGTAKEVNFKIGDLVHFGDTLAKIDVADKNIANGPNNFNANQIKQAKIAVEQAGASYSIAQTNYRNLLSTSEKDLKQIEISRNQASTGKNNTDQTTSENMKSAELAYETARSATELSRISLENRKKISGQSLGDTDTNIQTSLESIINSTRTLIFSINNSFAFDTSSGVTVAYSNSLGQLDLNANNNAKTAYTEASNYYNSFITTNHTSIQDKIKDVIKLTEKVKKMTDTSKLLLEKSASSANLPQTATTGTSLSGLLSTVGGYQASASSLLSQANGAKQALENLNLNNQSTIESLQKAYEIAKQQEASAKQNLANLKAGNKSQLDQVGYGAQSADNQYESTKIKLQSQISISRSQMEMAGLQYQNAVVTLESLYDIHTAISPIEGTVTKKMVENGDTVSAGQLLAVVSKLGDIKLQFYVDQDTLPLLSVGMPAFTKDNNGNKIPARVITITQQADSITKRFLVEVAVEKDSSKLSLGTVINIVIPMNKIAKDKGNIILPLSSITIGQNENYIYIIKDDKAKKVSVDVKRVEGEAAEIYVDLSQDANIIIDGAKSVKDGDLINIKN